MWKHGVMFWEYLRIFYNTTAHPWCNGQFKYLWGMGSKGQGSNF